MSISETTVRRARITGKTYTLGDSDGLALYVSARGTKSWHFRYYWLGKQKRMSFGPYPEISLKEARQRRDAARTLVANGINPQVHRQQVRQSQRLAQAQVFKAVFDAWLEHRRLSLTPVRQGSLAQIQQIFRKDILPVLGQRSVYDIKRTDLLEVLSAIEARHALTVAHKCRRWLWNMFRFAMVKLPGLEQNPAADLEVIALPRPPVAHNPFLRFEELPLLLQRLRTYQGRQQTGLALRLLLLTGVRTGELRSAIPSQFDLDRKRWVIPAELVKQLQVSMRKRRQRSEDVPPYIVPLSAQALEVVQCLLGGMEARQHYLLAQRSDVTKPISENTLNNALRSLGFAGQLTGHGIRATLATALNELEYPARWIEAQLSHADPDGGRGVYNHAMYVEQRAHMMQDWADRLDQFEQAGGIVMSPISAKSVNAPTGRELVQCGNDTHMKGGTMVTLTSTPATAAVKCSVNALQQVASVSASHSLGYCSLLVREAPNSPPSLG